MLRGSSANQAYPLTEPAVRPATICRSATRYKPMAGMRASETKAITRALSRVIRERWSAEKAYDELQQELSA